MNPADLNLFKFELQTNNLVWFRSCFPHGDQKCPHKDI